MKKVDMVGVGLNATDTLIQLAAFPVPGSKVEYKSQAVLPGGQTASTVIACARWGMSARYVGKVGDDHAAEVHRRAFAAAGVEARLIAVADSPSPQSLILVDGSGDRTVLCRRDERLVLKPAEISRDWVETASVLHVDGFDTAAATQAAQWARAAGVPVVGDLDELYPGIEALAENIDYLIVSRDFPSRLMEEPDLANALRKMRSRYGCRLAAATLGSAGVLAWDGERMVHRRAYRVPVADTTGAGDIFHAGFIYGLHRDWPLERQLDFACAAAAMNCISPGARGGIRTVAEIERLMTVGTRYDLTNPL